MDWLDKLLHSPWLVPVLTAWLLAQIIKVFTHSRSLRKFDFQRFVGSGGMPSSHSSLVTCAALTVGLVEGFDSSVFGLAVTLALVVMYDAAGVRLAAGKQAKLLNELVDNYYKEHYINQKKLKELLGHTPVEVLAGAMLGAIVAIGYYYFIWAK